MIHQKLLKIVVTLITMATATDATFAMNLFRGGVSQTDRAFLVPKVDSEFLAPIKTIEDKLFAGEAIVPRTDLALGDLVLDHNSLTRSYSLPKGPQTISGYTVSRNKNVFTIKTDDATQGQWRVHPTKITHEAISGIKSTFIPDENYLMIGRRSTKKLKGEGVIITTNTRMEGLFRQGELHGKGTISYNEINNKIKSITGEFSENRLSPNKTATVTYNVPEGVTHGVYMEKLPQRFEGKWLSSIGHTQHGRPLRGTITYADNTSARGEFHFDGTFFQ